MSALRHQLSNLKTTLYRKPKRELERLVRWGPRAYFLIDAWSRRMASSVNELPVPADRANGTLSCWFLTGRRFWYQTAYCAWTLAIQSQCELQLNLVDDGSLEPANEAALRRLFPNGCTIGRSANVEKLNDLLPKSRFPMLRKRWDDYINIRKLTDIHVGSHGPKLVLDSDMLFLNEPRELLEWIQGPQGICLMTDCVESYGYSRELMESIVEGTIPHKLNVGVCGLHSNEINWEILEDWCERLDSAEGSSYYLEQALIAMLAAQANKVTVMPEEQYITLPTKSQVANLHGTLQHYVADSKIHYLEFGWRRALQQIRQAKKHLQFGRHA